MKVWLKGGLIGLGVYILLLIIFWFLDPLSRILKIPIFAWLLIYPCILSFSEGGLECIIIGPLINILLLFIIGSLIGWLIGKRKNKQQPQNIKRGKTIK